MLDGPSLQHGLVRAALVLFAASAAAADLSLPAFADETTFDAEGETDAAPTVTCGDDLNFGVIALEPDNPPVTITVLASNGAQASMTPVPGAYTVGPSGPAVCVVAEETGENAIATLSAATGTFAGVTLSGVQLQNEGGATLSADLILNKATLIGNETLYVGGVLTIGGGHINFGTYSQTITLTVTD